MGEDGRVAGDPTGVLTTSGGSSYVALTPEPERTAAQGVATAPVRRLWFVGWIALALAVLTAALTVIGVATAVDGAFVTSTVVAWVAIVVSVVSVAAGLLAVIAGLGRRAGAIAIVLGLLANPFLLARLLEAASAATT